MISIAPLRGTTLTYVEFPDWYCIQHKNGKQKFIDKETFEYVFFKINDYTAALKEDCIFYATYRSDKPVEDYPDWFADALRDGYIYEDGPNEFIFYNESGDIAMSPNSIVLMNFMGQFRYMEHKDFDRYYERAFYCSY